jgi:lipopolysaccharide/colanic/teichoic acid biosynthesis glycosyltransferase
MTGAAVDAEHVALPWDAAAPFPVPPQLARITEEIDWAGFLPARAGGLRWRVGQRVKRVLDAVLAAALLLVLSPVLLVVALVVRLSSPGPILYELRVLGRHGRPFRTWKFRTMVENAEALKPQLMQFNEMSGPVFKMRNDPRVTRVGRWLRKYSLDELPQLWSVLTGELSLVGPRAPGPHEFVDFAPEQRGKLAVKPGITCLWQVSGRSQIKTFDEWAALDMQYIHGWNLWLDLKILLRTIPAVLRGDGAY